MFCAKILFAFKVFGNQNQPIREVAELLVVRPTVRLSSVGYVGNVAYLCRNILTFCG